MKDLPFVCFRAALFIDDFCLLCIIYPLDYDVCYPPWPNNDSIQEIILTWLKYCRQEKLINFVNKGLAFFPRHLKTVT